MVKIRKLPIEYMEQSKKQFPWSALATVGGSLLSGLFGSAAQDDANAQSWDIAKLNYKSQQETNHWNMLIAREANEASDELQRHMNAFNLDMWNKNNEYNSPVQQMQRAAAAGINPNMVYGQPVASSPVQQTSIPNQVTPHMEAPLLNYNPHTKGKYKFLQELGSMLAGLPFNKERLDILREESKGKHLANEKSKIENEILQYDRDMKAKDLEDRKNLEHIYNSMSLIQNVEDPSDLITPDEYESLSEDQKKKYNKTDITGSPLPNLFKAGFRSRAAFEAWKDVRNVPNFLQNIRTDLTQSKLRYLVDSKKIESDDAINALVNMDIAAYNKLLYNVKQIKQNLQFNKETWKDRKRVISSAAEKSEGENRFFDDSYITRLHILQMSDEEAINKVDRNALSLARKMWKDGKLTTGECAKLLLLKAAGFIE